jgi:hypothetical protein
MARIFKIRRARPKEKTSDHMQMQWREQTYPHVKVTVDLLPQQRTSNGDFFITLGGQRKKVSIPSVQFYATSLYEALNRIDFREISDISISSSVTSYNGPKRKLPLL